MPHKLRVLSLLLLQLFTNILVILRAFHSSTDDLQKKLRSAIATQPEKGKNWV